MAKVEKLTIDDLGAMIKEGLDGVDKRFNLVDKRFNLVEKDIKELKRGMEEIKLKFAYTA